MERLAEPPLALALDINDCQPQELRFPMPTYVYKFVETGETIEVQQAFTDDGTPSHVKEFGNHGVGHDDRGATMCTPLSSPQSLDDCRADEPRAARIAASSKTSRARPLFSSN